MNFKIIFPVFLLFFFIGCKQLDEPQKKIIKTEPEIIKEKVTTKPSEDIEEDSSKYIFDREYTNQGFALIYEENLFNEKSISKKLDNRSLFIFHAKIRKNSFVKITNPENTKTVIAQVISNKATFSNFYNSVITKRIVDELLLDENEPYVELSLISNESTFVAKKAKTFDEEKKVAQKAPVDGITIDNLGTKEKKELPKTTQSNFLYSIKIADFYYKDSAENMIQRIKDETKITNPVIKKLSQTKYRVLLGPFNDIKKIQESFDEIEKLNFENLKIIKDV
ncbi:SPOR domain-containing protein [Candidatus Pelagibacter sp. HIMB1695]|uniref:SPOR domain-containing protein n=1 Tax=Candidatus Pelagibacter sp. HIMB1695 TaxID=3413364 RepID=UPI003F84697D